MMVQRKAQKCSNKIGKISTRPENKIKKRSKLKTHNPKISKINQLENLRKMQNSSSKEILTTSTITKCKSNKIEKNKEIYSTRASKTNTNQFGQLTGTFNPKCGSCQQYVQLFLKEQRPAPSYQLTYIYLQEPYKQVAYGKIMLNQHTQDTFCQRF